MYKCLVWGTGIAFYKNINLIRYYELKGEIEVVGITSNMKCYKEMFGYKFYTKEEIDSVQFNLVIIAAEGKIVGEIESEVIARYGKEAEKSRCIPCGALQLPMFDFPKYLKLKCNPPTIFANNCWGGLTYHDLRLPFNSPFINMFESDKDYIQFLQEPKSYLDEELVLLEMGYNETLKMRYPICMCKNIILNFNHVSTYEAARENWKERIKRIQWDNLFVMMYTESPEAAKEFSELEYEQKICFVPFETDIKDTHYVKICKDMADIPFWKIVNGMATGAYCYYDVLHLLCFGEIERIGV